MFFMTRLPVRSVEIHVLPVGAMQENCYVVKDTDSRKAVIIDPGDDASYIAEKIASFDAAPAAICATHGHFDHILAAHELQAIYTIPFYIHSNDMFLVDRMQETARFFLGHEVVEIPPKNPLPIDANHIFTIGKTKLTLLETPGHTPGSVSFCLDGVIFAGDVLFQGGAVGRTDFSYSDKTELDSSIRAILKYPSDTKIYAGHGTVTTVKQEKIFHNFID
jgi:hydroxyacylglutathione hydrolase